MNKNIIKYPSMDEVFLSEKLNYQYKDLNNLDYYDYLFKLNKYLIHYQDILNIPSNINFGFEIEYENIELDKVTEYIENNYNNWTSTYEKSNKSVGEIISPVLKDEHQAWQELKSICMYLKENNAKTTNTGAHIHISSNIIENVDKFKKVLMLYIAFEDILFRFSYGTRLNERKRQKLIAYPIAIDLANKIDEIRSAKTYDDLREALVQETRFQGINFENVKWDNVNKNEYKNTIEIRMPNGTDEEIIWQNNLNVFYHLLNCSINNEYLEYINNEIEYIKENIYNTEHYKNLDIRKAFILADIIFNNNLSKTNFLRQYIKDNRVTKKISPVYSKNFIKRS